MDRKAKMKDEMGKIKYKREFRGLIEAVSVDIVFVYVDNVFDSSENSNIVSVIDKC